jgi:cbb3-type cytochrome oxidase subunit 1
MGIRFIKAAVIYFLLGVIVGLVMGASEQMQYISVHAHINLLGWASLGLIGVIYKVFPEAGEAKLARIQFILHNVGLPILVLSMIGFANDITTVSIPAAILGGLLVIVSVIIFVVNVFKHIRN